MAINIYMDKLYKYQGYTLIDITKTDVVTSDQSTKRNQQRNWETIYQILSLRAQLHDFNYLGAELVDLKDYSFGVNYTSEQRVWTFEFTVENEGIYSLDHDRYGTLKDDFKIAPIILGLEETVTPPMPLFYVNGPDKNIYFKTLV